MKPTIKNRRKSSSTLCRRIQASPAVFLALALFGVGTISPLKAENSVLQPVSGVVTAADTGKPIANALVRVSSPAIDMRRIHGPHPGLFVGLTDVNGRFRIQVPKSQKISLNAFSPGYEQAAGTLMSGNWTFYEVPFPANPEQEFNIKLRPTVYVTGIVTDDSGRPFSGADVEATIKGDRFTSYVAFDTTEANGRFEIFDFPFKPETPDGSTNARGRLMFRNETKLTSIIENVYALSAEERTNLHVILSSGHEIKGTILGVNGQPLVNIIVEGVPADLRAAQRTTWTDAEGRFVLRGLPDGEVSVQVHSLAFDRQARKTVELAGADKEVNLTLEPVVFKSPPKPVSLLGMKLAIATPELQEIYNLNSSTGVVILDPGTNHLRLGMGDLTQGERIWVVGDRQIENLREMVTEILRTDAIAPPGDPIEGCHGSVRVVYVYRNRAGTMTRRLKLTDEDRAELKNFLLTATP